MNKILIVVIAIAISGFTYQNFSGDSYTVADTNTDNDLISFPSEVKTIVDNSCMGCHNNSSKNIKGKKKLNFDQFNDGTYSKGKAVGKLNGIIKVLKKNVMPPKKFVKKYPERALSDSDKETLRNWALESANELMN